MSEKIQISFDKRQAETPPRRCGVKTTINTTVTTPEYLDNCLLVSPGDATNPEVLAHIATIDELYPVAEYPLLPAAVNRFMTTDPHVFVPGNVITVLEGSYPETWSFYCGVSGNVTLTVVSVTGGVVTVDNSLLSFANKLQFRINGGSIKYEGVLTRNYGGSVGTLYCCNSHIDFYDTADQAVTAIAARKQEIVNLLAASKSVGFSGVETRLYE